MRSTKQNSELNINNQNQISTTQKSIKMKKQISIVSAILIVVLLSFGFILKDNSSKDVTTISTGKTSDSSVAKLKVAYDSNDDQWN